MEDTKADPAKLRRAGSGHARLGWIGLGVMGRSMAGRLLDAGYSLTVFTRRRETATELLARGARWAETPAAVAAASDIVFTMVGYPADVREVLLGDQGALAAARPGSILVDHTTSAPTLAVEIAAAARERGLHALDAPVSGGDRGAREGTLTVMVGGDESARVAVEPSWRAVAGKVVACGGPGTGQQTKLTNQIAIASGMIGMCEALVFAARAGLDLETTLTAVSSGAAGSWSLSNLAPRILRGDLAPGFMIEHIVKDMRLVLDECRRMRIELPGLALAEALYAGLVAQGHGRLGTQALILALGGLGERNVSS
jgi:3-hydroxyisobutyrate dehydrogenase